MEFGWLCKTIVEDLAGANVFNRNNIRFLYIFAPSTDMHTKEANELLEKLIATIEKNGIQPEANIPAIPKIR